KVNPDTWAALAKRPHGAGDAGAHGGRPILHDVPRGQVQEVADAPGDVAEELADAPRALGVGAQPREQLGAGSPPDLREPFRVVVRRAVEQRQDQLDELVLLPGIALELRKQRDGPAELPLLLT